MKAEANYTLVHEDLQKLGRLIMSASADDIHGKNGHLKLAKIGL